jgi:hypothetical protein
MIQLFKTLIQVGLNTIGRVFPLYTCFRILSSAAKHGSASVALLFEQTQAEEQHHCAQDTHHKAVQV